jgi:hypothetical protein
MIGELLTRIRQRPVPQLDPVPGVQRLLADWPPIHTASGNRSEIDIYILVGRISPDLGMVLVESSQAQVGVRTAADDSDSGQKLELTRLTARWCLAAEREY